MISVFKRNSNDEYLLSAESSASRHFRYSKVPVLEGFDMKPLSESKRLSVHPIIKQVIDRDCHVGESNLCVVRHVISKLRNGYRTFKEMPKRDRKLFIQQCLHHHRENLKTYVEVMSGFQRTLSPGKVNDLPTQLSGQDLSRLMRRNRITIEFLAFRLGISQKRIRQARSSGIADVLAIRDWVEAITGTDPGPIPQKQIVLRESIPSTCDCCGRQFEIGDLGYGYVGGIFCSINCCRKNRGW